ncbi:ATP-binding protein [Thermopolyspora sp. NPDC052614]|uniref:ATP-binding protein n=1 Tax=Thermopolyspora sp. NPDC052614 TaxID=3155682 RepID=UPI003427C918
MTVPGDARLLTLSADRRAAGEARDFTGKILSEWAVAGEAVHDLLLIVSELVTNAVVHGAAPVHLRLWTADGCVRGAVDDHGDGRPRAITSGDPLSREMSENGRGLALVTALARTVSWHRLPEGGVRVWFSYALNGVEAPSG